MNIFEDGDKKDIKVNSLLSTNLLIFTQNQKYALLKDIIFGLYVNSLYLTKPAALFYLSNNSNIIFKLIDMTAIIHNINPVKVIFPPPNKAQDSKYLVDIINVEIYLLDTFSLYISILNFNDNNINKRNIFIFFKTNNEKDKDQLRR